MQQLHCVSRTGRRKCWLILIELAGGRSTGLNQLASPHFEEKEALSARQMRMHSAVEICAGRAV